MAQQELLNFATPKELNSSLDLAFQEFISSDYFSDMDQEERKKILFHWQLLGEYLKKLEPPKEPGVYLS
jgi:hypothetical protein